MTEAAEYFVTHWPKALMAQGAMLYVAVIDHSNGCYAFSYVRRDDESTTLGKHVILDMNPTQLTLLVGKTYEEQAKLLGARVSDVDGARKVVHGWFEGLDVMWNVTYLLRQKAIRFYRLGCLFERKASVGTSRGLMLSTEGEYLVGAWLRHGQAFNIVERHKTSFQHGPDFVARHTESGSLFLVEVKVYKTLGGLRSFLRTQRGLREREMSIRWAMRCAEEYARSGEVLGKEMFDQIEQRKLGRLIIALDHESNVRTFTDRDFVAAGIDTYEMRDPPHLEFAGLEAAFVVYPEDNYFMDVLSHLLGPCQSSETPFNFVFKEPLEWIPAESRIAEPLLRKTAAMCHVCEEDDGRLRFE